MTDEVDYDNDVLRFKQVWADNKNPDQTAIDPNNLMTIESSTKKNSKPHHTKLEKSQKPKQEHPTTSKKPSSAKPHQNPKN